MWLPLYVHRLTFSNSSSQLRGRRLHGDSIKLQILSCFEFTVDINCTSGEVDVQIQFFLVVSFVDHLLKDNNGAKRRDKLCTICINELPCVSTNWVMFGLNHEKFCR